MSSLNHHIQIQESHTISVYSIGPQILIEEEKGYAKNTLKVNIHQIIPKPTWNTNTINAIDRDQVCSIESFIGENGPTTVAQEAIEK